MTIVMTLSSILVYIAIKGNMTHILVPCDFSEQSSHAFKFAMQLQKTSPAEIHLLHIVDLPFLHDTVLMPVLSFEEEEFQDLRVAALQKMEDMLKGVEARVKTHVDFGAPSRKILDYITDHSISLVVMGTKGATGMREIFIGSNTEKIVRASGVPVIAVKDAVRPQQIKNIVFPNTVDSDANEDLIMKVKQLQHTLNAHLHVVYINTPLNFRKDILTQQNLSHFTRRYMLRDFTTHIFNDVDEENGIINFARMIDGDMIAVGTHGRKGLAHLLSGSLAEDLVNHSRLPIWTYTIRSQQ